MDVVLSLRRMRFALSIRSGMSALISTLPGVVLSVVYTGVGGGVDCMSDETGSVASGGGVTILVPSGMVRRPGGGDGGIGLGVAALLSMVGGPRRVLLTTGLFEVGSPRVLPRTFVKGPLTSVASALVGPTVGAVL